MYIYVRVYVNVEVKPREIFTQCNILLLFTKYFVTLNIRNRWKECTLFS